MKSIADREILSVRLFLTPRTVLFEAFSDPKQLVHWWGPEGFTNDFHEFDFQPGGIWRFVMRSPQGTAFENEARFLEIAEPKKIAFEHLEPVHRFQMTMTFTEKAGKTELAWHMIFESATECAKVKAFILKANEQNFDRLENYLKSKGK